MNELLAFGNGDTARMNTYELYQLLKEHLPEERAKKLEHNNIVKKAEKLMAQGVIHGRQPGDQQINQGLGRKQTIKVFEFVGEDGRRDMIILMAQFMPELIGLVYDHWRDLLAQYRELEQKVLVLMKNEALAEEAEALKEQMENGTIDTKDAMDKVAIWTDKRKGTGSKHGKGLAGQRKLKRMEKELNTIAISYVQPQLPFN